MGVGPGAPVGVVGAGTMGAGIAEVAARAGHPVRLLDTAPGAAARAVGRLRGRLADRDEAVGPVHAAEGVADLSGCRLVVEAVVEDLGVKRALLRDLDSVVDPEAVLATNTSSLSVTALAAAVERPERVLGLHFFNPATRMRLVEVVRGDATAPDVVDAAADLVRAWGKTPVVCTSTPGFVVNRVARPFYGEAQRIVEEGAADPATVDAVLREAGGFRMGPFELADLVGQDVNLAVSRSVWEQTFHDPRYAPTVFQQRLVDAGRLGRKTGRGVYAYGDDGRALDAHPRTEPPVPPPTEVELVGDPDAGFPVMAAFLERVERGGVHLVRRPADEDDDEDVHGLVLPDALLSETDGLPATTTWSGERATVLLDWAHDPATCTRVALMPSGDCPRESLDAAVGLCQAAGAAVSVIGDSPGGVVARTVTMLVNEAVELVVRGEASAADVDVAMLLGTAWPSGPVEWADRLGPHLLRDVVTTLGEAMPSGRYRASPAFDRTANTRRRLRDL